MSTAYQIVTQSKELDLDIEEKNRFYKTRDISSDAQSQWIFKIFQFSMSARIKAIGIVATLFAVLSMILYVVIIELTSKTIPKIVARRAILDLMPEEVITEEAISEEAVENPILDALTSEITQTLNMVFAAMKILVYMCYMNMMFFIQNFISLIYIKKMGRFFDFPNFVQVCDLALFISSITMVLWFAQNINTMVASEMSQAQFELQMLENFEANINFKF